MDPDVYLSETPSREKRRFRSRKLRQYALQNRGILALGFLFTALTVGFDLGGTFLIGRLLDREIEAGASDPNVLLYMLGAFLATILLAAGLRYLSTWYFERAANRITVDLQNDVFQHVQKLPIAFFDRFPAGRIVSRITNDAKAVGVLFRVVLVQLVTVAIYGLGIYASLLALDVRLFLIALTPLPVVFWLMRDFRRKAARFNRGYRRANSAFNAELNENIQGMEVIQATRQEEAARSGFERVSQEIYRFGYSMTKLFAYSAFNATYTLEYILLAFVMLYFGYGHVAGLWLVPIGNLYIFVDYMNRFFGQIVNAMTRLGEMERATGAADHIFELMLEEEVALRPDSGSELLGGLSFEKVTFAYDREEVLKDVSFSAQPGQTLAFVGHTGSGKTTLMNLLFDFYEPQVGDIFFDGRPLKSFGQQELRRQMAIVLQDPFLFEGSILTNLTLGDQGTSREEARTALLDVGGGSFLTRLPQGLDTPVREKGQGFSAGERQLISFARALLRNPRILILDEATASIDSETEQAIEKGIARLKENRTTLIIAHRLSTIRHADQIYVLDRGRITEQGSHAELIEKGGIYRRMYEAQSQEAG